jgi:hypothetical protein
MNPNNSNNPNIINYYSKEVYGNILYYLDNPTKALAFRALTSKKTLTLDDMAAITALTGVTFTRVFEAEA